MDFIWSDKETSKINIHILDQLNLIIVNNETLRVKNPFHEPREFYKFAYKDIMFELNKLLFFTNKKDILDVLQLSEEIQVNSQSTNRFTKKLTKINPKDPTEIFTIFGEIIFQYNIVTETIINDLYKNVRNTKIIKDKIFEIEYKNNTELELYIKNELEKIFRTSNGITDTRLFKPLITKLNNNLKVKILTTLNRNIINKSENNEPKRKIYRR